MIPKIIHYCWLGGAEKPKSVLKCIESWKKYCPDYEIKEWNETNLDFDSAPVFVKQAYESKAWGFVPDYFRLWIVYEHGGIYLDTDVQVIKNLNPLLSHKAFAGFEGENNIALGLGFGAEAKNKLIYEHLKIYKKLSFIDKSGNLNKIPSPVITTQFFLEKGVVLGENKIQNIEDMILYPKEYFAPKDFDTGITKITKNTYSIHQYDASWFSDEEKHKLRKSRRKYRWDKIRYFPNNVLKKILGEDRYQRLKNRLKKK